MLESIDEYIIGGRVMDIVNNVYTNNMAFRKYNPKIMEIRDSIINSLPQECKGMLEDLENCKNIRDKVLFNELYLQGLIDGLRLNNIAKGKTRNKRIKRHTI